MKTVLIAPSKSTVTLVALVFIFVLICTSNSDQLSSQATASLA